MECQKCGKKIEKKPRFVEYLCEKCGEETRSSYDQSFLDVPLPSFIKKIIKDENLKDK